MTIDELKTLKPNIYQTLTARAVNRGFVDLTSALDYLENQDLCVVYVVLKEYDLSDIYNGVVAILEANGDMLNMWYKTSWTKTVVLFGDPEKLSANFPFIYKSAKVGFLGPWKQSDKLTNLLMNYTFPLRTALQNIADYTCESDTNFTIYFGCRKLSLGKFIVQIVHTIAEVVFETKKIPPIPSIKTTSNLEDLPVAPNSYEYLRIDGGHTEVEPFSLLAKGVVL